MLCCAVLISFWNIFDRAGLLAWFLGIVGIQGIALITADKKPLHYGVIFAIGTWGALLSLFGRADTWAGMAAGSCVALMGLAIGLSAPTSDPREFTFFGSGIVTGTLIAALALDAPYRWQMFAFVLAIALVARHGARLTSNRDAMNESLTETNDRLIDDLRFRADHDALTGIYNRTRITERLNDRLEGTAQFSCLLIDIDGFRSFNEIYGTEAGDTYLRGFANRLSDQYPNGDVGRIESDRFVVMYDAHSDLVLADAIAQTVELHDAAAATTPEHVPPMTCTIGLLYDAEPRQYDRENFIRTMHATVDAGKLEGGNTTRLLDDELSQQLAAETRMRQQLAVGLERNEVVAYVQPIVDLRTGAILGGEVLARWLRDGVEVPAYKFIETAQRARLLNAVDDAMFEQVVGWRAAHPELDQLYLSLNVGPDRLYAAQQRIGRPGGGDLRGLVFEMTERGIIDNPETATAQLNDWRDRGARIYLDDFGTGFSSLDLLTTLPIDGLKIDRKFVQNAKTERPARAVIAATVELARRLDLALVAEGIETRDEAALTRDMGVHAAQGWLFLKAVPLSEFTELATNGTNWAETLHAHRPVDSAEKLGTRTPTVQGSASSKK